MSIFIHTSSTLAPALQLHHPGECVVLVTVLKQVSSPSVVWKIVHVVTSYYLRQYRYACETIDTDNKLLFNLFLVSYQNDAQYCWFY